jgi:hypothetical protein
MLWNENNRYYIEDDISGIIKYIIEKKSYTSGKENYIIEIDNYSSGNEDNKFVY